MNWGTEGSGKRISSRLRTECRARCRVPPHHPVITTWATTQNQSLDWLRHPGPPQIHLFIRERERESTQAGVGQMERERISGRLLSDCRAQCGAWAHYQSQSKESVTWLTEPPRCPSSLLGSLGTFCHWVVSSFTFTCLLMVFSPTSLLHRRNYGTSPKCLEMVHDRRISELCMVIWGRP